MFSKNKIKYINSLSLKKNRKKEGLFIAEGKKTVEDLLSGNYKIEELYISEDFEFDHPLKDNIQIVTVDFESIRKISQTKNPQGILAIVRIPKQEINYKEISSSLCIFLDDIQDPGNLGTIVRLANWFGISHIICSNESVDVYNPKVVQATMGSLAGVNIYYLDPGTFFKKLESFDLPVYGTYLEGANIYETELTEKGIIVLGNEANGISENVSQFVTKKLNIPSYNKERTKTESLNIAIAASLVCAEFKRKLG